MAKKQGRKELANREEKKEKKKTLKIDINPRNENQRKLCDAIDNNKIIFCNAVAGVGKGYISVRKAVEATFGPKKDRKYDKIVLVRPYVTTENIGFLPGDVHEKFSEFLIPLYSELEDVLGKDFMELMIDRGKIEIAPLGFMRGRTFKKVIIICDESQNLNEKQMLMLLSRFGEDSCMILIGDSDQRDLKTTSGLEKAVKIFEGKPGFGVVKFDIDDVVRDEIVKTVLKLWKEDE